MFFADNAVVMHRADLKALLAHVSRDAARPNLHALVIDLKVPRVFACDGPRLLVASVTTDGPTADHGAPCLVPVKAAEQAAKHYACRFTVLGQRVRWEGFDKFGANLLAAKLTEADDAKRAALPDPAPVASGEVDAVQAVPPPIRHVIPNVDGYKPAPLVGFRAEYLGALSLLGALGADVLRFRLGGPLDPLVVTGTSTDLGITEWLALVMPVRL